MMLTNFSCWKSATIISLMFFLISCTTTAHIPEQKYLDNTSLVGIRNVAVLVTVSPPEVIYAQAEEINITMPILLGILVSPLGPLAIGFTTGAAMNSQTTNQSKEDQAHADNVVKNLDLSIYEDKLSQSFIETLRENFRFETIDYKRDNRLDNNLLVSDRYEGVIKLFLNNLILEKVSNGDVRLSANIKAQMINLNSSEIIWDRDDSTVATQKHTISYYKKNGFQELEAMLEKAGKRLAYDFIYLK